MFIMDNGQPFFRELRDRHHFDVAELARKAGTHEITVVAMLRGMPVYRAQAEKVLQALSEMTGRQHTLENVRMKLIEEADCHAKK